MLSSKELIKMYDMYPMPHPQYHQKEGYWCIPEENAENFIRLMKFFFHVKKRGKIYYTKEKDTVSTCLIDYQGFTDLHIFRNIHYDNYIRRLQDENAE